jgi:gliding motility-associated-like protein
LTGVSQANLVAGNYTVNILDANNCPGTGTVVISQPNLPLQVDLVSTDDNCSASSGSINATVSGGTAPYSYSWTPNAGNTNLVNNLSAGNYSLTVTDANLCQINASAIVNASATASISINPGSQTISEGSSVQLSASGALTYSWSPSTGLSCNACPNPLASPSITTTYVVTGIDANGCAGTAQITLSIQKNCADIFVPNIFSPNGSGPTLNNAACVFGSCVSELNYTIYDRWGEVVFSTSNVNLSECWDGNFKGKPMNSGVFVYKLIAKLEDGTFINESGNLTLVR